MNKSMSRILLGISVLSAVLSISSCATSNSVADKAGVQLWTENCNRCHNSPSPADFSDVKWERIGTHMQVRANLTQDEVKKIIDFMQSAN